MKHLLKLFFYNVFSKFIFRYGSKKNIYITFDDGPHPENTPAILKILGEENIKATFFMVGSDMELYPDVVNTVIDNGHEIGYHSYYHDSLKTISLSKFINDLNKTKSLEKQFKFKFKYYRPPYGDLTILASVWLILNNWKIAMWSLDSMDSFNDSEDIIKLVNPSNINEGEILLFHDDYKLTVDILPTVLSRINNHGFQCKKL